MIKLFKIVFTIGEPRFCKNRQARPECEIALFYRASEDTRGPYTKSSLQPSPHTAKGGNALVTCDASGVAYKITPEARCNKRI